MDSNANTINELQQIYEIINSKFYNRSLDIIRTGQEMNKFELRDVSMDIILRIKRLSGQLNG